MMDGRYAFKRDYNAIRKRKMLFVAGCILVAFVAMGLQLSVGKYDITFLESYGILFDHIMGVDPGESQLPLQRGFPQTERASGLGHLSTRERFPACSPPGSRVWYFKSQKTRKSCSP